MTPTFTWGNTWTVYSPAMVPVVPKAGGRRIDEIAQWVADKHKIGVRELRSHGRRRYVAWPRFEAMWLTRQERLADGTYLYSLPQIGAYYGGRDHTSVLWGIRRHEQFLAEGFPNHARAA